MKVLIVIDMQNDFVTGSLGSKEAQNIVPGIAKMIENLKGDDKLIFTRDTHYKHTYNNTLEGKKLPIEHCFKGTFGHQIVRDLLGIKDARIFDKGTFGSIDLMNYIKEIVSYRDTSYEIHIVGVCSDICVISNALALRMAMPNKKFIVHKDLCAGSTPEKHEQAMSVMESCQIDIVEGVGMYD